MAQLCNVIPPASEGEDVAFTVPNNVTVKWGSVVRSGNMVSISVYLGFTSAISPGVSLLNITDAKDRPLATTEIIGWAYAGGGLGARSYNIDTNGDVKMTNASASCDRVMITGSYITP